MVTVSHSIILYVQAVRVSLTYTSSQHVNSSPCTKLLTIPFLVLSTLLWVKKYPHHDKCSYASIYTQSTPTNPYTYMKHLSGMSIPLPLENWPYNGSINREKFINVHSKAPIGSAFDSHSGAHQNICEKKNYNAKT